jgi:hypothetical protein
MTYLALLALLALAASLARLRLAPGRSLTARLMFRGRRGRRLIGPRLLLAATALSARTWRSLLVGRRHGALLLRRHGGPLRRGHGPLPPRHGALLLRRRHGALLLRRHGGPLRRGHGAPLLPWHGGLLASRGHGTLALARNGALRWRRRRPLGGWQGALGRRHSRRT